MNIVYTTAAGQGDTDLVLFQVAQTLLERGRRVCGLVQVNTETCSDGPCDMDVRVLPDGPLIRISQSLGKASRGCRLDPQALETAVGEVQTRLDLGADLLIINKFGRHEAEGRGFRSVIAQAVSKDVPVVLGLNDLNKAAFFEFIGDTVPRVDPNPEAVLGWFETCQGQFKATA